MIEFGEQAFKDKETIEKNITAMSDEIETLHKELLEIKRQVDNKVQRFQDLLDGIQLCRQKLFEISPEHIVKHNCIPTKN